MGAFDFDLFVIGGGSGGVRAARVAATAGARVAVAEEHRLGGTCVIRGCVPKKLLVYASEYPRSFADAEGYGWTLEGARFDWSILRDNVAAEVDRLSGLYQRTLENAGVEVIHDRAELVDAHAVRLVRAERTLTARHILIATGGRPVRPRDIRGCEHAITSDEAFGLEALPKHVVIAGGGYIAVEFASIFHGLGVETCLVYRGEAVLRGFDEDVRAHVQAELTRLGVRVVTGAVIEEIEKTADGCLCRLSNGQGLNTGLVMLALGREPYVGGLGLEAAGVALDPSGAVIVDPYSRTTAPSIGAVGDVTNRINLTPVAIREGQAWAETHFLGTPAMFDHADVPTAVFGRPPVGCVGLTEAQARTIHKNIDVYKTTFRPMKHTIAGNEERVLMKLVVEADSQRVLGVHIAGADGPEMIQLAAVAVKAGLTKPQWDATCALHPTVAEELVTMREKVAPADLKG